MHVAVAYKVKNRKLTINDSWQANRFLLFLFLFPYNSNSKSKFNATSVASQLYSDTQSWFLGATNQANVTLAETFPIGVWTITSQMFIQLFMLVNIEIFSQLLVYVYDEVKPSTPSYNMSYGSPFYYTIQQRLADQYLHSGQYKSIFTNGLLNDYNYLPETNLTFEEFADQAYEDFDVEAGFYEIEALLYQNWYAAVMDLGRKLYEEEYLYDITTAWMR